MPSLTFEEAKQRVGTPGISAMLAAAGGFLDAFTYVGHGRVFATAMTGNVVLLGINLLSGSWPTAFPHIPAILAFLAGICVAEAIQARPKRRDDSAPYIAVLVLEVGILTGLSLLPATAPDVLFTAGVAFAAAIQVQTFREVNGHGFNSTFTTGNLRTLAEAVFAFFEGHSPQKARVARDFFWICIAFLAGATAGSYATHAVGNIALWFDVFLLVLIAIGVRSRLRLPPADTAHGNPDPL